MRPLPSSEVLLVPSGEYLGPHLSIADINVHHMKDGRCVNKEAKDRPFRHEDPTVADEWQKGWNMIQTDSYGISEILGMS